jgi:uncharacterized phage protein gp47/JayE
MGNTLPEIRARMTARLTSAASKIEGSFQMDNIGAVAAELARMHSEDIDTLLDKSFLDTAVGDYLDRRGLDFGLPRKENEECEDYRIRLYELIRQPQAPGNVNSYIAWAKEVDGIGRAKCFEEWAGNGTVKVSVITPDGLPPDVETLSKAHTHIENLRPIGAKVTVTAAVTRSISVDAAVIFTSDADTEFCKKMFEESLRELFKSVAYDGITTYLSYYRIGEMLFAVPGIMDVSEYTINGDKSSITLGAENIFVVGEVNLREAE